MRFKVCGQTETTRKPIELVVDAPDEPAARRDAEDRGVVVRSVAPIGPMDPITVRIEPGHVQLIELTGKRWKLLFALSAGLFLFGAAWSAWSLLRSPRSLAHPPLSAFIAAAIAALGLIGIVAARLGAWWKHG